MYRKRAWAAGAVLGTVITLSSRLSRCIYTLRNSIRSANKQKKPKKKFRGAIKRTNSRTDLLLGRKVRGPASRSIETSSSFTGILIRSERTHPPSRVCFSISFTFTVGNRRERWKAEESPVRPPPKTAILFGGINLSSQGRSMSFVGGASCEFGYFDGRSFAGYHIALRVSADLNTWIALTTNNGLFITTPSLTCGSTFGIWCLQVSALLLLSVDIAPACSSRSTECELFLW